jgi:hypothetical protein
MAAETDSDRTPDTVDVSEAAALVGGANDVDVPALDESAVQRPAAGEQAEPVDDEKPDPSLAPSIDEAPEYWRPEEKAMWAELPERVRSVLSQYERLRVAYGQKKALQTREAREEASRAKEAAASLVEQSAAWWQQNGPAFRKAFVDKWAGVDWKALAEKDPAEVQRLIAERQQEETLLAEADRRGQADIAAARQQEEQKLQAARQAEHAKLAERLPDFFGPERARQTYDELSRFLFAKGIPADRIAAIYEAPVIELALSAMRFENAQRALRSRASGGGGRNPVKTTPTRIDPGPGNTPGNRNGADLREVGERFRQSGGASIADAAELIRLSGL